ncbi:DNA-binding protein [Sinosporangium siamense]|uniref:DNA-binding protein n=1 Tax=Sinosporangium siamense TaxID=1367973 RepID=A0A919RFW5_9ACTN|nr:DNA-binding protein [Sinosporangium siamense]GII91166.1 hypothetical protein Ssi02_13970 [Sinosporangium siamense]
MMASLLCSQDAAGGATVPIDLPKTSNPARRALAEIGITHLDQLTGRTAREILKLHGVGPSTIPILREALAAHGLSFRDE